MFKHRIFLALACVILLFAFSTASVALAGDPPPALTTLQPGGFRDISQNLTVNVVFVGYEPGAGARDINETAFRAGLPNTYRTLIRAPFAFGYGIKNYAYNVPDSLFTCCLGYADDNWADGTQSFVFGFDSPSVRAVSGYGFTTTFIHEVGHHVGMSHPHDGYDYQSDVDFGPGDAYYFAWSGDESNSMMSYIDLNWDFSQFDRDNMNRYMTSVYINQANVILAGIYASPRAGQAASLLTDADAHAATALTDYAAMNYLGAVTHAKIAYGKVLDAAAKVGVVVEQQAWQADHKARSPNSKFVDTVDYHRNRP